jgi:hypothetical protein
VRIGLTILATLLVSGCIVPKDAKPSLGLGVLSSTEYNHRGMVENERGVVQGDVKAGVPLTFGGTFEARAWGNMDMTYETGDAWMPRGHAGEFTEVDLTGSYLRTVGPVDLSLGVTQYVLPNGSEYLNESRGTTTEVFASVGGDVLPESIFGFYPLVTAHQDIDEADGVYVNGGIFKGFELMKELSLHLGASIGYSNEKHSIWTYGVKEDGFSDLRGTATLSYRLDEHTTIAVSVAAWTLIDTDIERWVNNRAIVSDHGGGNFRRGINTDTVWGTAGVSWKF